MLRPPLVLLAHGFTQTHASWAPVTQLVEGRATVLSPDAPGHGEATNLHLNLEQSATRLAELIGERSAVVVGYSMGARTAIRLALDHPSSVSALLLIGGTAGIEDQTLRAQRRRSDEDLAMRIQLIGVERFLDEWMAQSLFDGLELVPEDLCARRNNSADGLASSLRLAGTGTMEPPWWDDLHRIEVPTVVMWGEHDTKFAALGKRMVSEIGSNATSRCVDNAGHAVHLQQPDVVAEVIVELIDETANLDE
ncbi:MAG: alpha/beta fold hydrolase [Acidimicrobiales bacterium]|nr:alpha/beta fold hydrolase [Acidimicrobiales bacterium]